MAVKETQVGRESSALNVKTDTGREREREREFCVTRTTNRLTIKTPTNTDTK